jgi:hypothetical protein
VNVGCGPVRSGALPDYFSDWRTLRVDIDASVDPDIIADATDLSAIKGGTVDAIWSAHCIEHLYQHDVTRALTEFYRLLSNTGFVCVIVPDLQSIARYVADDRLHEVIYESAAGPITAHDILFGHGRAIAEGHTSMAHHCGFTPTLIIQFFKSVPFADIFVRRRPTLELAVVAKRTPFRDAAERDALITALRL